MPTESKAVTAQDQGGLRSATARPELTKCPGVRKHADDEDSQRLQSRMADGGLRSATERPELTRCPDECGFVSG